MCDRLCSQLGSLGCLPTCVSQASRHSLLFFPGQLHHHFSIDKIQGGSLDREVWRVRMMGGGPRTYPGGMTKWEWNRVNEQKRLQGEEAKRIRDKQVFEYNQQNGLTSGAPQRMPDGNPQNDGQTFKSRRLDREHANRTNTIESNLNVQNLPSSLSNAIGGKGSNLASDNIRNSSHQSMPFSQPPRATSITENARNCFSSTADGKISSRYRLDNNGVQNGRTPKRSDIVDNANSELPEEGLEEDSNGAKVTSLDTKKVSQLSHLSQSRFDGFNLSTLSIRALHEVMGYERMTIVQEATLPIILRGQDVLAKAKTGTGKTIAFLLPAIEQIIEGSGKNSTRGNPIQVLVICPARELAMQAASEAAILLKYHKGLGVQVVIGGTNMSTESSKLNTLPSQVLVATPGRLLDHIENTPGIVNRLKGLKVLVLDEADRLLDMGFRNSILSILKAIPKERQSLLFSATIPKEVHNMAQITLKLDHKYVDTVGEEDETHSMVKQQYIVAEQDKIVSVIYGELTQHIEKEPSYKVLVFCITANITAFMASLYTKLGFNVREIHSRKSQAYRTRVSDEFRASKGQIIMFTSDVSARGIDYPDVTFVLQVGLPSGREQYIHRLGRTGRAGKDGEGMLLLLPWEKPFLTKVKDLCLTPSSFSEISSAAYQKISSALAKMDDQSKEKAYQSWLGYYLSCALDVDKRTVVQLAAQFSTSMGLYEPPTLPRNTIRKMGLNGVL